MQYQKFKSSRIYYSGYLSQDDNISIKDLLNQTFGEKNLIESDGLAPQMKQKMISKRIKNLTKKDAPELKYSVGTKLKYRPILSKDIAGEGRNEVVIIEITEIDENDDRNTKATIKRGRQKINHIKRGAKQPISHPFKGETLSMKDIQRILT